MGRWFAVIWHFVFSAAAGALYFFYVLPRWDELSGNLSHAWGTALRIVCGALIGLAALPVVLTLLRTRRPEYGTPQLALTLRLWSTVCHVLAGVLIIGTAISEIWFSLDDAGKWLFGIYGAAAAIAVLGIFAFYLAFVAELPAPPPRPLKSKTRKRRGRRKAEEAEEEASEEAPEGEDAEAKDAEAEPAEEEEPEPAEEEEAEEETTEVTAEEDKTAEVTAAEDKTAEVTAEDGKGAEDESADDTEAEPARGGLRNRRPSGKTTTRRRRLRGGVAVEE